MDDDWPECETCTRIFRTQQACNQHMANTGHWRNYCPDCERHFQSESNLRAHMNSRIHRGASVACPFCGANYTTASGLAHHLETGSCPRAPQLNRESVLGIIRERDPHGAITHKELTWHGGTRGTYQATDQAWNGASWECYLCHRQFRSSQALNQHLNSPAHQQKVYHCPKRQCRKEFVSLAALFNQNVQEQVGQVLSGNRLIAF